MTAHAERRGALTVGLADDGGIDLKDANGTIVAIVLTDSHNPEASLALAHQMAAAPLLVEALEARKAEIQALNAYYDGLADESVTDLMTLSNAARDASTRATQLLAAALLAARAPERSEGDGDG